MPKLIRFQCPCGRDLRGPVGAAGRKAKCPRCLTMMVIPTLEELAAGPSPYVAAPIGDPPKMPPPAKVELEPARPRPPAPQPELERSEPLVLATQAFDDNLDQQARATLTELLASEPDNVRARVLSARLFERQQMYRKAFDEYRRAVAGGDAEARAGCEKLARERLMTDAQRQLVEGAYREAIETADRVIEHAPDLIGARLVRIECLMATGAGKSAQREIEALGGAGYPAAEVAELLDRLGQKDPAIGQELARQRLEQARAALPGQVEEEPYAALERLEPLIEQFPGEAELLRWKGQALEHLDRDLEAVVAYKMAMDLGGQDLELVAHCYGVLAGKAPAATLLPWLGVLIDGGREPARYRRDRARLYRRRADLPAAIADLHAAFALQPGDTELAAEILTLQQEAGDEEGQIATLGRLIEPGGAQASGYRRERARLFRTRGNLSAALADLQALLDEDPQLAGEVLALQQETGDVAGQLATLARLIEAGGAQAAGHRRRRAALHLERRDLAAALADLWILLDADPHDAELSAEVLALQQETGDADGQLATLGLLIEAGAGDVERHRRERAALHRTRGDLPAAIDDLQALLARHPANPGLVEQVVSMKQELGDLEGALAHLTELLAQDAAGADPQALLDHIAALRTELGDVAGTLAALRELVQRQGDQADPALIERVVALETETGDVEGALAHLGQLLERLPQGDEGRLELLDRAAALKLEIGDVDGALGDLSALLEQADPARMIALLDRTATIRVGQGDLQGALDDLTRLLERTPPGDPLQRQVIERMLHLRRKHGDRAGALTELARLRDLTPTDDPTYPELVEQMVALHLAGGERDAALGELHGLRRHVPESAPLYGQLVDRIVALQLETGDAEQALAELAAWLELAPTCARNRLLDRTATLRLLIGDREGALADLIARLASTPEQAAERPELERRVVALEIELARGPDALDRLQELLPLAPDHPALLARIAALQAAAGDLRAAEEQYRAALGLEPDQRDLLFNLGNCQLRTGRLREAIASYTRALELDPGDRQALINRAACYRQVIPRQHARARADLQRALG